MPFLTGVLQLVHTQQRHQISYSVATSLKRVTHTGIVQKNTRQGFLARCIYTNKNDCSRVVYCVRKHFIKCSKIGDSIKSCMQSYLSIFSDNQEVKTGQVPVGTHQTIRVLITNVYTVRSTAQSRS